MTRALALIAIVLMPWQFASFARDYFTDYPQRSAPWIDTMNFQGVARYVIDNASNTPAVFLSDDDIGEDKAVKWKFHLLASQTARPVGAHEISERQRRSVKPGIASGSVLILSASNARLGSLTGDGWSVATIVHDAAGSRRAPRS